MFNNNYQHLFDMAPIIFNDRLQSALESFTGARTISWGIKSVTISTDHTVLFTIPSRLREWARHNFDFNWFTESVGVL